MEQNDNQIEQILGEYVGSDQFKGITKHHWKPINTRTNCADCHKQFSLTCRKHNCQRCGDLFCKTCAGYQRRLNVLSKPDPSGRLYKVCKKCYDQGPQSIGISKSWTHLFKAYKHHLDMADYQGCVTRGNLREKLNINKECERLKKGFLKSINSSTVRKTFSNLKELVVLPDWQKSPYAGLAKLSSKCYVCNREFNMTRSKYNCVVCGVLVCAICSSKDLLVYIPDNAESDIKFPSLTIIKIVGCPPKEPATCVYLRVCALCQHKLEELQFNNHKRSVKSTENDPNDETWIELDRQNDKFRHLELKIDEHLPVYQDLVDFLERGTSKETVRSDKSNTQTLAKAQGDLSDHLSDYIMQIYSVKKIKPCDGIQTSVYKNIIRSKCTFYQENIFIFRETKKRLVESTPTNVLESIQATVDRNAINSCYLTVKQVALEILHLCNKHNMEITLPTKLALIDEVLQQDLKDALRQTATSLGSELDWETHSRCIDQLIKDRLAHGQNYIRPSRTLVKQCGTAHIIIIIKERCDSIIRQSFMQLNSKCAHKSFKESKRVLDRFIQVTSAEG